MTPSDLLAEATAVADAGARLAARDLSTVADAEAVELAVQAARAKAASEAFLVGLADRLGEVDMVKATGWASLKDFLTHLLGGHKGAGGGIVRLAEQTRALPAVRMALASGVLSTPQARVIAARITALPRDEAFRAKVAEVLIEQVTTRGLDATDLDHAASAVIADLDPDRAIIASDKELPLRERGAHSARFLSFSPDRFGGVRIKGYASLEEAEIVKATLMPMAAPVTTEPGACGGEPGARGRDDQGRRIPSACPDPVCDHTGRDLRDAGTRMWDALVEACRRLQGDDLVPHTHGTTARLTITLPYDALQEAATATGHLASGAPISAAALRRLACDAEILPAVLGGNAEVLDLGRTQRLVTPALFNALVLRDRHCAFPGCSRLPLACAHHILHWADGGPTSLTNLVLLCRRHHTLIHHSPWRIEIDPDTCRPRWIPPPIADDRDRFTFIPASRAPQAA